MECSPAAADNGKNKTGENKLCEIIQTEVTQQSQKEVQSRTEQEEVKDIIVTEEPRLSPSKRPRVSENDNVSTSQSTGNPRFARTCKKCPEIRKSLKLEIAKIRKENSRVVKNLREEILLLKRDKENLQNTVNFLQSMYTSIIIPRKT